MKMLRLHTIFAIIAICGMFFSCEESADIVIINPPNGNTIPYYPMEFGNTWLYTDTIITNAETTVTQYYMVIVLHRFDSTGSWWKFQSSPDTLLHSYELMIENDTVFDLQWGWGGPFANNRYIKPPLNDTLTYLSLLGGDIGYHIKAYHYQGCFSTPAGLFGRCDVFQTNFNHDGTHRRYEIIAPGVGLVGVDYYSENYVRKVRLTNYWLNIKVHH